MNDIEDEEEAEHFDVRRMRNYVAFVRGALRRHKRLSGALFTCIVLLTLGVVLSLPKSYHVEAKVLAHRNAALTVRGDDPGADTLTRTAAETVMRRESLLAMVAEYHLVEHWHAHRSLSERARDKIGAWLSTHEETEQDRIDAMVDLLETRLNVWTNEGGSTVSIALDWPDAQMACTIVEGAQRNYLEARHTQEVTALAESIALLLGHADGFQADIDRAIATIQRLDDERAPSGDVKVVTQHGPLTAPLSNPTAAAPRAVDPRLALLQLSIDAKQHMVNDLEDFRHRRLADLQARLADNQAVYTEKHPAVVDLEQTIAAISTESPQVVALREQIAALRKEREGLAQPPTSGVIVAVDVRHWQPPPMVAIAPTAAPPDLSGDVVKLDSALREDRDPHMVYARGELHQAMDKYSELRTKIQAAQFEYETAQAAFKYRYSVVTPAHLPRKPTKPNVLIIMLLAVFAAGFAAVVMAVIADIRTGRLVERWQVEQLLGQPILADVQMPQLPEHVES